METTVGGFVQGSRGIEPVAERSSFKGESLYSGGFDAVGIRLSGFRDAAVDDQRELTQRNRWRLMQYGLGSHLERNRAGNTARRDDPELMPPGRRVGPESDLQPDAIFLSSLVRNRWLGVNAQYPSFDSGSFQHHPVGSGEIRPAQLRLEYRAALATRGID